MAVKINKQPAKASVLAQLGQPGIVAGMDLSDEGIAKAEAVVAAAQKAQFVPDSDAPALDDAEISNKPKLETTTIFEEVDELAELLDREEAYKKDEKTKRLAQLKKLFQEAAEGFENDNEEVVFNGTTHKYVLGPRADTREVSDMYKLRELVGDDVFMQIAKVNLGDIDKYLTEAQRVQVLKYGKGGRSGNMLSK